MGATCRTCCSNNKEQNEEVSMSSLNNNNNNNNSKVQLPDGIRSKAVKFKSSKPSQNSDLSVYQYYLLAKLQKRIKKFILIQQIKRELPISSRKSDKNNDRRILKHSNTSLTKININNTLNTINKTNTIRINSQNDKDNSYQEIDCYQSSNNRNNSSNNVYLIEKHNKNRVSNSNNTNNASIKKSPTIADQFASIKSNNKSPSINNQKIENDVRDYTSINNTNNIFLSNNNINKESQPAYFPEDELFGHTMQSNNTQLNAENSVLNNSIVKNTAHTNNSLVNSQVIYNSNNNINLNTKEKDKIVDFVSDLLNKRVNNTNEYNLEMSEANSYLSINKSNTDLISIANTNNDQVLKRSTITKVRNSKKEPNMNQLLYNNENNSKNNENKKDELTVKLSKLVWEDKTWYLGETINNKSHGIGIFSDDTGDVYRGYFNNEKSEGFGIFTRSSTNDECMGEWKNDKQHGITLEFWNDSSVYCGDAVEGKKQGIGIYEWPNGYRYEGEWKNGLLNGFGIYHFSDNKKYLGEWKNNQMHGYGELYSDAHTYRGYYYSDKKEGFGILLKYDNLKAYLGMWKNGKQHGLGKVYTQKTSRFGLYVEGKRKKWYNSEDDPELVERRISMKGFNKYFDLSLDQLQEYLESI